MEKLKGYSPTSLNTFIENCPAALEFYRQRKDALLFAEYEIEGPEMAEIGIVFHACVHAAALARKEERGVFPALDATAAALAQKIEATRVFRGREMANEFIKWWEFPNEFQFEHGVGFDQNWNVTDWESDARKIRLIFDAVGVIQTDDDESGNIKTAVGQDYKTGWGVRQTELDSIQMDAYLSAMRALIPDADAYRIEVIATRFHRVYSKTYFVSDEDDMAELHNRSMRLKFFMQAADNSDVQPRIGSGCLRCNFTAQCSAFASRISHLKENNPDASQTPEELARDLAILQARTAEIVKVLQVHAQAHGPIPAGNSEIGYHVAEERSLKDPTTILDIFLRANEQAGFTDDQKILLKSLFVVLEPGVTMWDKVVGKLARTLGYKTQTAAKAAEALRDIVTLQAPKWSWQKIEDKGIGEQK